MVWLRRLAELLVDGGDGGGRGRGDRRAWARKLGGLGLGKFGRGRRRRSGWGPSAGRGAWGWFGRGLRRSGGFRGFGGRLGARARLGAPGAGSLLGLLHARMSRWASARARSAPAASAASSFLISAPGRGASDPGSARERAELGARAGRGGNGRDRGAGCSVAGRLPRALAAQRR